MNDTQKEELLAAARDVVSMLGACGDVSYDHSHQYFALRDVISAIDHPEGTYNRRRRWVDDLQSVIARTMDEKVPPDAVLDALVGTAAALFVNGVSANYPDGLPVDPHTLKTLSDSFAKGASLQLLHVVRKYMTEQPPKIIT